MKVNVAAAKQTNLSTIKKRRRNIVSDFKSNTELMLLALPGVLYIFIFAYLPMPGIILAFKKFMYSKGIIDSPFIGLENFRFLFLTDAAARITRNTILMNMAFMISGLIFTVGIALLLFEIASKTRVKIYQTLIIFPNFLSWVVVSYMFYGIMNPQYGVLNGVIKSFGGAAVDWYSRPELWPIILIITGLWKGGGMGSVIYYATLMGIDKEYFEAAAIDGATKWQITKYITLPFLYPMMTLLTILSVGNIIRSDFGMFYTLTRDVPTLYSTTDVVDTYVFRALRKNGDTGMAAAAGLYQSIIGFILIVITNYIVRKKSPENSLF